MDPRLDIAQIAPLIESVPPEYYGGTERIVSYLTEELVRRGHRVTLFASGDSETNAELVAGADGALRLSGRGHLGQAYHLLQMEEVLERAADFDVVHSHLDVLFYPFARRLPAANLSTLHGRLDLPGLREVYREYDEMPLVSISEAQRRPIGRANWFDTIYHGLPMDLYRFRAEPGDYLAFLGRISPEKRVDSAIRVALRAGIPLKIAAKVDEVDRDYFHAEIEPMLDHRLVEFVGEIDERQKGRFLGDALGLLFLVDWPEPFGLAMIEAMACGTPVIARRVGSVPEVVDEGRTGWICRDEEEAVICVRELESFDRREVRRVFERRFSVERMADDYLVVYRRLLERRGAGRLAEISRGSSHPRI